MEPTADPGLVASMVARLEISIPPTYDSVINRFRPEVRSCLCITSAFETVQAASRTTTAPTFPMTLQRAPMR
jgi:hypothetical protein